MKRRQFISEGMRLAIFVSASSLLVGPKAVADISGDIADLEHKDLSNACQSSEGSEGSSALIEVNPASEAGLIAHSVGCKSPHKHLIFIPARFFANPQLIESEA